MDDRPPTAENRVVRALRYRASRLPWAWRRGVRGTLLRGAPRVLCNSIQKSGTHLLVGVTSELSRLGFFGRGVMWHHLNRALADSSADAWDQPPTVDGIRATLSDGLPGEVIMAHLGHRPEFADALRELEYRHVLVVRDPRDAVVSLFHWWKRHEEIRAWPFLYFRALPDDTARLRFLIEGWPEKPPDGFPQDVDYPGLGARVGEFLPWREDPECLVVRFEDLVDPDRRGETFAAIAGHVYPGLDAAARRRAADAMVAGTDPGRSRTFRKGGTQEWRTTIAGDLADLLRRETSDALVELGYEDGADG